MVRHFILILSAKTGKLLLSETTTKRGEWLCIFFGMVERICELGIQHAVEIVHVGTEKYGKTFTGNEIEEIGKMIMEEEQ